MLSDGNDIYIWISTLRIPHVSIYVYICTQKIVTHDTVTTKAKGYGSGYYSLFVIELSRIIFGWSCGDISPTLIY